jgi:hypothetical protein
LGKLLSQVLYLQLYEIPNFFLGVSGTIGIFFIFSLTHSMVPAGKEQKLFLHK